MNKAYDIKLLGEKLKEQGLDLAEEGVKSAAVAVFNWIEESAKLSPTPYDDMGIAIALPKMKEEAFKAIDHIDGKIG